MLQPNTPAGLYTLRRLLGEGAFGQVWLADKKTNIGTNLRVALKLLPKQAVNLEAIRQEAEVWEDCKGHPNILPLVDVDIYSIGDSEYVGIASHYIAGGSLSDWLKGHGGRAPSAPSAVAMALGILNGLTHLHTRRPPVIHRDLKPANILLQGDTPLLADFGLARAMQSGKDFTHSKRWAGTMNYTAPEALDGEVSFRTDIWAVGVMLYRMLGGCLPFGQEEMTTKIKAIIMDAPPPLPDDVPPALCAIAEKALAKDKSQRYANTAAMSAALRGALAGNQDKTEEFIFDRNRTEIDYSGEKRAEAIRQAVEESERRIATEEALRQRAAEAEARRQADALQQLAAEEAEAAETARLRAEAEAAGQRKIEEAQAEARRKAQEEARLQAIAEARQRQAEETRRQAEVEAQRKAKEKARLQAEANRQRQSNDDSQNRKFASECVYLGCIFHS